MLRRAGFLLLGLIVLESCARAQAAPDPTTLPTAPAGDPEAPPWMGARIETAPGGVLVTALIPDAPAQRGGVLKGDLIMLLDGDAAAAADSDVLIDTIRHRKVGSHAVLHVRRGDRELDLDLLLEARPDARQRLERTWLGKPAPALAELPMLGGTLPAPRAGEVLVLEVWATYCGACRSLTPVLAKAHEQRAKSGVHVLAVSAEREKLVRRFLARKPLAYPVGSDASGKLSRTLQIEYIPTFLAIQDGTVRAIHVGANDTPEFLADVAKLVKRRPAAGAGPVQGKGKATR